jgi:hypothetical protein
MMLGAAALAFVTLTATPAKATTVTYTTEASIDGGAFAVDPIFTTGSGVDTVEINYVAPVACCSVTSPSDTSFGSVNTLGTGTVGGTIDVPFTLEIIQTAPSSGTGTLAATLSGTIAFSQASGTITFTETSTEIAGVTYSVLNDPLNLEPTSGGLTTSIQGYVSTVPEPVTTALVGVGLLGLGILRRRKA